MRRSRKDPVIENEHYNPTCSDPEELTLVAAHSIEPRHRIQIMASFLKPDQFKGSFGSSLG
jgi:hypothetical protein